MKISKSKGHNFTEYRPIEENWNWNSSIHINTLKSNIKTNRKLQLCQNEGKMEEQTKRWQKYISSHCLAKASTDYWYCDTVHIPERMDEVEIWKFVKVEGAIHES